MAALKKGESQNHPLLPAMDPLSSLALRHRRALFLRSLVKEKTERNYHLLRDKIEKAHVIIIKWADLEQSGNLPIESKLDAEFLGDIFGTALGYRLATDSTDESYELEREYNVPREGTVDGAVGQFRKDRSVSPTLVIELKSVGTNLDRPQSGGRTPVQQCWGYLNGLPDCPWGIVSNISTIRLFHRDRTPSAFEQFSLQEMRKLERFREFYLILGPGGIHPTKLHRTPLAIELLDATNNRQKEVGDELYQEYSNQRNALIDHLTTAHTMSLEKAIGIAQKLIDRIVFVAFCEDRGLLPDRIIDRIHRELPPLARVTNPRWQNFLNLFRAVDEGHDDLGISDGYNGGLFRHDPDVDELELDDEWTHFFHRVGRYDFRDEVNVDVLGGLFEKSVTEIEKIRQAGLLENGATTPQSPMPKSARRKRFGIYYTPPDFTERIVRDTIGALIDERLGRANRQFGIDGDDQGEKLTKLTRKRRFEYWQTILGAIQSIRICDPACGSGAFLIAAYDYLERLYSEIIDQMIDADGDKASALSDAIPEMILSNNLYGVDLLREAVEITQLALWLRSARLGHTLEDLSGNIVCGNSLVDDSSVHPLAMKWEETFPSVFKGKDAGFDCVIGNPPWERLKLQEREFFSLSAPEIASAVSAAQRRKLIAKLERDNPQLHQRYEDRKREAEQVLEYARQCGDYPNTGKGDINTYALFAELAARIVAPRGRVGLVVPSGIASDKTTRGFFNQLMDQHRLISLLDFENRRGIFRDVHRSFKFCMLVFGGADVRRDAAQFAFFCHSMEDLDSPGRTMTLSAKDMRLMNPNTKTCPVFRTRRDMELTRKIYRRVPILIDRNRKQGGNPWGIRFVTMFHQTNDAELFVTEADLKKKRYTRDGSEWKKGKSKFVPLYEAKMIQAYDHRAASVVVDEKNWMRQGQTEPTSLVSHQNPEFTVEPRWWVNEQAVVESIQQERRWLLGFKDITSPTNERTMIASVIPWCAVTNHFPILISNHSARHLLCLLANLNAFVLDFTVRQKIGGVTLNFFIVEQIPVLPPDEYADKRPWTGNRTLRTWISDRVLKLTCTANDMLPLAKEAGFKQGVHKWKSSDRARLRAEIDAAYFHLYGLSRDDVEYILSTFSGTHRRDDLEVGSYRTRDLILECYDGFAK